MYSSKDPTLQDAPNFQIVVKFMLFMMMKFKEHWKGNLCIWQDMLRIILANKNLTRAHLIWSGREGMLQGPSARDLHLVGPRRWAFSAVAPFFWNILHPEVRHAPSVLIGKSLKIWLRLQASGGFEEPETFLDDSTVIYMLAFFVGFVYLK